MRSRETLLGNVHCHATIRSFSEFSLWYALRKLLQRQHRHNEDFAAEKPKTASSQLICKHSQNPPCLGWMARRPELTHFLISGAFRGSIVNRLFLAQDTSSKMHSPSSWCVVSSAFVRAFLMLCNPPSCTLERADTSSGFHPVSLRTHEENREDGC